jgi:hypothetical protein
MKILNVLTESAAEMYRDLTNDQAIVLARVAAGAVTPDTASPRERAVLQQLADLGLVNELDPSMVTQLGTRVANFATKLGPRDARVMQQKMAAAGRTPQDFSGRRRATDVGFADGGDPTDNTAPLAGDELAGGNLGDVTRTDTGEVAVGRKRSIRDVVTRDDLDDAV